MKFLRTLLAVILGFFISMGILFVFFLIMISAMSAAFTQDKPTTKVKDNSILVMDFNKPVKDYGEKTTFEDFDFTIEDFDSMNHILTALKNAASDDRIKGISLKSSGMISGTARIKELREALKEFKKSGKFIYAYNDIILQSDYYLQTVADSIFLNPMGYLDFKGLASEVLFFKGFEDQTGIKMEVIRHGKYKSAVEPFISETMSEANRLQLTELLNSIWSSIISDISESRNISVETLNQIADNLEARTPQKALDNHIIDRIIYQNQYDSLLVEVTHSEDFEDLHFINIERYAEAVNHKAVLNKPKDKIAVIYAEGEVIYGTGMEGSFGQNDIHKALEEIREDKDIKAIVLRVNSPGGSALASELIHHDIELIKESIPVYVSMGNLAASGGYYISCNANRIFADAGTITGSIGVFGMLPNAKGLADKWGINAEQVATHKNAKGYSIFEKPSEEFIEVTTESIENIYDIFVKRVAEGRNMTTSEVNEIAQGRVWSGLQALEKGLVDEIGTLEQTIAYVADEQGISEYSIEDYPTRKINIDEILQKFGLASIKEKMLENELGSENYQILKKMKAWMQQKGVQARLPFEIEVK